MSMLYKCFCHLTSGLETNYFQNMSTWTRY